ncbi:MAG TPA: efflux RND transporter periplasmic adaptor subunit [Candidatus Acidoferrum sp.]|nr:efflux RND transporter periplasmic adaptor subunit [Candidatus Acidoferrum sp.]
MKRIRNLAILVAAIAIVVVIAVIVSRGNHSDALGVRTIHVTPTTFQVKLPESGVIMRPLVATVPTLIAGNVQQIYVKAGDPVSAGQTLATIENPTLSYQAAGSQADYTSASANVTAAQVQERNAGVGYRATVQTTLSQLNDARRIYLADRSLYENKAIPRNQLDEDKAKLDQAQVAFDQAQQQEQLGAVSGFNGNSVAYAQAAARKSQILSAQDQQQLAFTRVTAPFDGTIQTVATQANDATRTLQSGDPVTQGQALFTIAHAGNFVVKAEVDEQDVIDVRIGQRVNVGGQDFPGRTILGHVTRIAPVAAKSADANNTAKQVETTIALDSSPSFLRDGMSADVDILTTYVPHAIVLPNDAVTTEGSHSYVYVVENGVAHKRIVRIGKASDTQTWISSGLRPGEVVVAVKTPGLTNERRVKVLPSPSASPSGA